MRTYLNYNIKALIKILNSKTEFYEITENKNNLNIIKKYKNKRGRPFSIILPKEINISSKVVGLIFGEGFISNKNFIFANSNEKAIDKILKFLKQFNLPVKFYLEISIKNQSKKFVKDCINFWQNYLNIKLDKIRLRKEFNNITKYGTIHIIVNNSLTAKLLKQIIDISKKKIENNRALSIDYLKGILAAEGNINVKKKTNCVYMVRISASKQEERNHYKRCLEKIGMKIYCKDMATISKQEAKSKGWKTTKGRAGAVIISRWDNFIKILELGLLELNEDKKEKFQKYLLNNKFTKQFLSFNNFIGKKFTLKEAKEHFNFSGRHLDRVLTLWKKGYINRRSRKNYHIYKLNNKYIYLYNKLKLILDNPIY